MMLTRTMRLLLAVVIAAGLLALPTPGTTANAKSRKTTSSKKTSSKKGSSKKSAKDQKGKSSKKTSSKKSKRDNNRAATFRKHQQRPASTSKRRGKNEDNDQVASSRAQRTSPAPVSTTASRRVMEASAPNSSMNSNDDSGDAGDNAVEEAPAPKPANRLVADIATTRVIQIQNALISKGLLAGPPTGVYDQPTFSAMASFQSRNGWNPVGVPTADSLKALGVPKNSGRGVLAPARIVEMTAPK